MTDTPDFAIGDRVEVLFAYLGPDDKPEPGSARRRYRGMAVEVDPNHADPARRLVVQVQGGPDAPVDVGSLVAPYAHAGTVSVRVLRPELRVAGDARGQGSAVSRFVARFRRQSRAEWAVTGASAPVSLAAGIGLSWWLR